MEIALLQKNSIRIKGKQGTLVVDPTDSKTEADAVLLLDKSLKNNSVTGSRLTAYGPGEYEIAGIKITAFSGGDLLVYSIKVDTITVIVGNTSSISKAHDKLTEPHIIVAHADNGSLQEAVTALAPRVVLLYGEKAKEEAKLFGKEEKTASKYQTTIEKLPADMEVVVLE